MNNNEDNDPDENDATFDKAMFDKIKKQNKNNNYDNPDVSGIN